MSAYQPYTAGQQQARPQTQALMAMLLGKPFYLPNPQDHMRELQKPTGLLRFLR